MDWTWVSCIAGRFLTVSATVCVLVSRVRLCDLMDCSPPGFSVPGILQARILVWIAIPFSKESSQPRDQAQVSHIAGRFFTIWATNNSKEFQERFFPKVPGWAFCNEPRRQVQDSLKPKPQNQTQLLSRGQKALLLSPPRGWDKQQMEAPPSCRNTSLLPGSCCDLGWPPRLQGSSGMVLMAAVPQSVAAPREPGVESCSVFVVTVLWTHVYHRCHYFLVCKQWVRIHSTRFLGGGRGKGGGG